MAEVRPTLVLLHSPLVGPASWEPVREEFERRGRSAIAPDIKDSTAPYWRSYVDHAVEVIDSLAVESVALVPHSGAGSLVAAIAAECAPHIEGIVFVDAALPMDGWSRLGELEATSPQFAAQARASLEAGTRYPDWSDDLLARLIPDEEGRRRLVADVRPRSLGFFTERIPAPNWPRPRCAYRRLSAAYTPQIEWAASKGWPSSDLELQHFGALVDPVRVASEITRLLGEVG